MELRVRRCQIRASSGEQPGGQFGVVGTSLVEMQPPRASTQLLECAALHCRRSRDDGRDDGGRNIARVECGLGARQGRGDYTNTCNEDAVLWKGQNTVVTPMEHRRTRRR